MVGAYVGEALVVGPHTHRTPDRDGLQVTKRASLWAVGSTPGLKLFGCVMRRLSIPPPSTQNKLSRPTGWTRHYTSMSSTSTTSMPAVVGGGTTVAMMPHVVEPFGSAGWKASGAPGVRCAVQGLLRLGRRRDGARGRGCLGSGFQPDEATGREGGHD
jgi:hypothetical protein